MRMMFWVVGCVFWLGGAATSWALPHPYFSKHPKQAKKLQDLLQQTSLKALEFQPADLSLSLTDLKGNSHSLEQYRGNVLVLTRWATWCGACKTELPYKLKLARKLNTKRVSFIGISDEDVSTVKGFTSQAPASYPINLVDPKGLMQKFFPGGAIPVTILVDAWGWVIAMKTGGAAWDTTPYVQLHRFLVSIAPSKKQLQQREKAPAPKVSFAKQIRAKAGQTFGVTFALKWLGERDKYSRMMFRLPKEKGLRVLGVSTSGISGDQGANERQYILRIKATKAGTYSLDPILLTYWLKDYDGHFQVPVGSMSVDVAGYLGTKRTKTPLWSLLGLGAAGCLILVVLIAAVIRKRRKDGPQEAPEEGDPAALKAAIQKLLAHRDNREIGGLLSTARGIRKDFLGSDDALLNELDESFRYGGQQPSPSQLKEVIERLSRELKEEQYEGL